MGKKKLIPFDLEKAKQGAKVVTRDGHEARIICWDMIMGDTNQIVALVKGTMLGKPVENPITYTDRGEFYSCGDKHNLDLFMAPTIVERWVNVYKNEDEGYYNGCYYETEQEARQKKDTSYSDYVTTTKITWEE